MDGPAALLRLELGTPVATGGVGPLHGPPLGVHGGLAMVRSWLPRYTKETTARTRSRGERTATTRIEDSDNEERSPAGMPQLYLDRVVTVETSAIA